MVTIAGNLVSGRVTYGLGVGFGIAALLAPTLPTKRRPDPAPATRRAGRCWALLTSAASPVANLFVGLAGAALLLTRRNADGLLRGGAVVPWLRAIGQAVLRVDGGDRARSRQLSRRQPKPPATSAA